MTDTEKEDFAAFCGGLDPATLSPQARLGLWHKFKAGTPGDSEAAKLRGVLEMRHGSVEAAPLSERSRLAHLEGPRAALPLKPRPPVSADDLVRNAEGELERLEVQLADMERPLPGATFNLEPVSCARGEQDTAATASTEFADGAQHDRAPSLHTRPRQYARTPRHVGRDGPADACAHDGGGDRHSNRLAATLRPGRDFAAGGQIRGNVADGVRLLALTGLRIGEIRALRWENFDRQAEVFRLQDSKTGARAVRLSDNALALVSAMERQGDHIITAADARQPVGSRSFSRAIEAAIRLAGVEDASAHTFRHTVATYMAQHGDSAPMIAAMGGWKTLTMVQRYVNLYGTGKPHQLSADQRIANALRVEKGTSSQVQTSD